MMAILDYALCVCSKQTWRKKKKRIGEENHANRINEAAVVQLHKSFALHTNEEKEEAREKKKRVRFKACDVAAANDIR